MINQRTADTLEICDKMKKWYGKGSCIIYIKEILNRTRKLTYSASDKKSIKVRLLDLVIWVLEAKELKFRVPSPYFKTFIS